REDVDHGAFGPLALVHVVGSFGKPRQVHDPEVGAARRPAVRRRLTEVVEPRPDEHPRQEIVLLDLAPRLFVQRTPGRPAVIVARDTVVLVGRGAAGRASATVGGDAIGRLVVVAAG